MTTRTTTSTDASSTPATSSRKFDEDGARSAFDASVPGNDDLENDPRSERPSKDAAAFIEGDEILNTVINDQGLQHLMPNARKWLANEFYGEIAPTLAALRLHAGLSQSELATLTNQPQSSISRLESGSECPSIERAHRMAQALNVSLDAYYAAWKCTRIKGRP